MDRMNRIFQDSQDERKSEKKKLGQAYHDLHDFKALLIL
jgi:hypothetical protein